MKCRNRTQKGRSCICIIMHRAKDSKSLTGNQIGSTCLFEVNISGGTVSECTWHRFSLCSCQLKTESAWTNHPLKWEVQKYDKSFVPVQFSDLGVSVEDRDKTRKGKIWRNFFFHPTFWVAIDFTKLIIILFLKGTKKFEPIEKEFSIFN